MAISEDEQAPLLDGVDGINYEGTSSQELPQQEFSDRKRKQTIRVLYFTMFIGSISFSIVMASLWPFLQKLDPTVSETFLGWVNSGYSFAQMISSIVMGYWCEKRNAKEPFFLSIVFLATGSALYSYAEAFGSKGIWAILGGRLLLGLNAGCVAVARSVAAQLTTTDERASIMAKLALWQATGFFVGPAIQALAKPIGTNEIEIKAIKLYINIYTLPGYFMILLCIINLVLLLFYFAENIEAKKQFKKKVHKLRRQSTSFEPIDFPVLIVCLVLWFIALTIFSLNETIITPVVMSEYGWSRKQTVFYTSIILAIAGVIAIICFLGIAPLEKRFGDKIIMLSGYIIMLAGFIFYLPWGPGYPNLKSSVLTFANGTTVNHVDAGGGCPYQYEWCQNTPKLAFWQFLIGATLVGIGYPIAAVLVNTLYSKVIGPFPQGKYMGWLTGVGSLARVVGPIFVTAIFEHGGMRWTATSICILLSLTMFIFVFSWRRLVPYNERFRSNSRLRSLSANA